MTNQKPLPVPAGHQRCRECRVAKPWADFEPSRHRACGIAQRCRPCLKEFREDRAAVRQIVEDSALRMLEIQYAPRPTPNYQPPAGTIPEEHRKTDEYFRSLDAQRRNRRVNRRA